MDSTNRAGMEGEGASFYDVCRSHGLMPTPQRQAIFEALAASRAHPDASTLYRAVKEKMPSVSLDTVYRNLRSFEAKGMVTVVTSVNDAARYDADVSSHSHFVCRQCGSVMDVSLVDDRLPEIFGVAENIGKVQNIKLEFQGVCKSCSDRNMAAEA